MLRNLVGLTQVPEYLVSRQEQWEREAERRKAEAPDPSCPPGMKLMAEEDRLQTLRQLKVCLVFVCASVCVRVFCAVL